MNVRSCGAAICLLAAVTVGCGTAASATTVTRSQESSARIAVTGARASCRPVASKSLVLTQASTGKTICVRVGTKVTVYLRGTRSQPWTEPVATGHALKGVPNGAFSLVVGLTAASYAAARPGKSLILSVRPPCLASVPIKNEAMPKFGFRFCPPDRRFAVTVIVVR